MDTSSILNSVLLKVLTIPAILFAFSWRGFSQAFVAKKLGDNTPENNGMLTMNPMAHIDIFGFICIVLIGFGWGKPVPTNSYNYKNFKRDKTFQILSGPVGLILGAFIMALPAVALSYLNYFVNNQLTYYLFIVFSFVPQICLTLAFFYMLPLPGLDGFNLVAHFLPPSANSFIHTVEKYSLFIFIGFILLLNYTSIGVIITGPSSFLYDIFVKVWSLPFALLV